MKVVCAWCQPPGIVPPKAEPQGDVVSHGICDEHATLMLAEARRAQAIKNGVDRRDPQRVASTHSSAARRRSPFGAGPEPRGRAAGRLLLIVSREQPDRFTYLRHQYSSDTVEVIVDRRVGQRRRRGSLMAAERRSAARRRRDITEDLRNFGWALVRRSR